MVNKAIAFAANAHKDQKRKGTNIPYIVHPMEVAAIVAGITDNPDMIVAALLHDTVEDCEEVTLEQIRQEFGDRVAEIVDAESENKSDTWQKRKGDTIESLKIEKDHDKKILALGDKLANMRSLYRDYGKVKDDLWQRFNMKDKQMQGWYYKGICEALSDLSDMYEYQEFKYLVDQIFE